MNEQTLAAAEANFVAYFSVFAGIPGTHFHRESDVACFVAPGAPGTHVLAARFTPDNADRRIKETMQTMQALSPGGRWVVLPIDTPANLDQRLAAHGLRQQPGSAWMLAELNDPAMETPMSLAGESHFRVEQVKDAGMLAQWGQATQAGFECPPQVAAAYHDAYAQHGWDEAAISLHFNGYAGAQVVTSGTMVLAEGIAGIYDISTPPAFRRHGFASALIRTLCAQASQRGYRHACLQAERQNEPFYQRLGFQTHCHERAFHWRPPAPAH